VAHLEPEDHPTLEEVRAIARFLRNRNLAAETAGEARMIAAALRAPFDLDRRTRDYIADSVEMLTARGRPGRPRLTSYQRANTANRWRLGICRRIALWEKAYRSECRQSVTAALETVAKETGFSVATLQERWQQYGSKLP
jgi:hypothetical protein